MEDNELLTYTKQLDNSVSILRSFMDSVEEKTDFQIWDEIIKPDFLYTFKKYVSNAIDDIKNIKSAMIVSNLKELNGVPITIEELNRYFDHLLYLMFVISSTVNTVKHRLVTEDTYYQYNLDKIVSLSYFNGLENRLTELLYVIIQFKEPLINEEPFKSNYMELESWKKRKHIYI